MRVIQVSPTVFGRGGLMGGGERYPLELARALRKHVDCELVTFGVTSGLVNDAQGARVRVIRPWGHLRRHPAQPVSPALWGALAHADIVHTHHLRSASSRVCAVAARMRRQRLISTDHGASGGNFFGVLPRLFDRFLEVSQFSAQVQGTARARTRIIYGGADVARFAPDRAAERQGVLFVGRLTPHKGVDRLIEAVPPATPLVIVGTGGHDRHPPERDYPQLLRRLAEGRSVYFAGGVSDEELASLYRQAAVVVLPSVNVTCYGRRIAVSELLGLSLLEAMASGTPVIASRVGGVPEVVADGVTGYLVDPGDTAALREQLAALLGRPRLARRLGDNARELVLERFTWDAVARRCLDSYNELVESGRFTGAR
jgi:glycosyltransferase involved in cell wall biosynthesis